MRCGRGVSVLVLYILFIVKATVHSAAVYQCDFSAGVLCPGWRQGNSTEDDIDWTVHRGRTPSANTGPHGDHSVTGTGYYIYVETSGATSKSTAKLYTPPFVYDGWTEVTFWYHMKGIFVGNLNIYYQRTGGAPTLLWWRNDDQSQDWLLGNVTLNTNGSFQFIFEGTVGSQYADIALDDVTITLHGADTSTITTGHTYTNPATVSTGQPHSSSQTTQSATTLREVIYPIQSTVLSKASTTTAPVTRKENAITIYRYITKEGLSPEEVIFISVAILVSCLFWTAIFILIVCYVKKQQRRGMKHVGDVEFEDISKTSSDSYESNSGRQTRSGDCLENET